MAIISWGCEERAGASDKVLRDEHTHLYMVTVICCCFVPLVVFLPIALESSVISAPVKGALLCAVTLTATCFVSVAPASRPEFKGCSDMDSGQHGVSGLPDMCQHPRP